MADLGEVRDLLELINQAWVNRNWDELSTYFHADIVSVAPHFEGRVEGRDAAVNSYKRFMETATVTDFQQSEEEVSLFGDTAIASCKFEISWTEGDKSFHDTGHDVFVFKREGSVWQAIWRLLVAE